MICLTTGFIYLYAKSLLYGCKTQFRDSFLLYIHDQLLVSKMNVKGKIWKKLGGCQSQGRGTENVALSTKGGLFKAGLR